MLAGPLFALVMHTTNTITSYFEKKPPQEEPVLKIPGGPPYVLYNTIPIFYLLRKEDKRREKRESRD